MVAFDTGLAAGTDGIELDVRLSLDGVAVAMHDPTLDRTTDATGPVEARTAGELAGLDAGYRFALDGAYPFRGRGIGVPSLGTVLDRYRDTAILVELKSSDPRLARAVVDAVHASGAAGRVTVGSFQKGALEAVRALDPVLPTGADAVKPAFTIFQVPEIYAGTRVVTPEFIARAHAAGIAVMVWTVNHEADMQRLLEWGVDGLITDRPDLAVPLVRDWYGRRAGQ